MHPETHEPAPSVKALAGKAILLACLLSAGLVVLVTCTRSDPVAPDGSLITVTANPQTVVSQGGLAGRTKIIATLRSKNGTRLPDQEVTFSTTAGTLVPQAQTPILSDSQGQASSFLDTTTSATVTAFSGSIMGTTTVNVVTGNLSSISIDSVTPSSVSTCNDMLTVAVSATDPNGDGVANVTIVFTTTAIAGTSLFQGGFSPSQPRTDATGVATTVFTINQTFCNQSCSPSSDPNAPNAGHCGIQITAKDVSGAFVSQPVQVTSSIQ
jgi:hypothetical protein